MMVSTLTSSSSDTNRRRLLPIPPRAEFYNLDTALPLPTFSALRGFLLINSPPPPAFDIILYLLLCYSSVTCIP